MNNNDVYVLNYPPKLINTDGASWELMQIILNDKITQSKIQIIMEECMEKSWFFFLTLQGLKYLCEHHSDWLDRNGVKYICLNYRESREIPEVVWESKQGTSYTRGNGLVVLS